MENWKLAVIAGSTGLAVVAFLNGRRSTSIALAGIGVAALASEYPEEFAAARENLHGYAEHAAVALDIAARVGEKLGNLSNRRDPRWYDTLLA